MSGRSNQAVLNHLLIVSARCAGEKRKAYRFSILKAIRSIQLYPLPIETLEEAQSLDGVGPAIAKELMKAVESSRLKVASEGQASRSDLCLSEAVAKPRKNKIKPDGTARIGLEKSPLPKRSCFRESSCVAMRTSLTLNDAYVTRECTDSMGQRDIQTFDADDSDCYDTEISEDPLMLRSIVRSTTALSSSNNNSSSSSSSGAKGEGLVRTER